MGNIHQVISFRGEAVVRNKTPLKRFPLILHNKVNRFLIKTLDFKNQMVRYFLFEKLKFEKRRILIKNLNII